MPFGLPSSRYSFLPWDVIFSCPQVHRSSLLWMLALIKNGSRDFGCWPSQKQHHQTPPPPQTINLCQAISLKRCRRCLPLVLIGPWSIVGEVGFCLCLALWISSVLQIIFHNYLTWKHSIWLEQLTLAFSHLPILTHLHSLPDIVHNKRCYSTPFYLVLYHKKKTRCSTASLQI